MRFDWWATWASQTAPLKAIGCHVLIVSRVVSASVLVGWSDRGRCLVSVKMAVTYLAELQALSMCFSLLVHRASR